MSSQFLSLNSNCSSIRHRLAGIQMARLRLALGELGWTSEGGGQNVSVEILTIFLFEFYNRHHTVTIGTSCTVLAQSQSAKHKRTDGCRSRKLQKCRPGSTNAKPSFRISSCAWKWKLALNKFHRRRTAAGTNQIRKSYSPGLASNVRWWLRPRPKLCRSSRWSKTRQWVEALPRRRIAYERSFHRGTPKPKNKRFWAHLHQKETNRPTYRRSSNCRSLEQSARCTSRMWYEQ